MRKGQKNPKDMRGPNNPNWRGGLGYKDSMGYIVKNIGHGKQVKVHREIVESIIKIKLPQKAVVHHINGIEGDNSNNNFIVCENQAYHLLIHKRERAFNNCGHANWIRCYLCKKYDDPRNIHKGKRMQYHVLCTREYRKSKKEGIKNEN